MDIYLAKYYTELPASSDLPGILAALNTINAKLDMQAGLSAALAEIDNKLNRLDTIIMDLSTLQTAVESNTTVEQSAITLLEGLKAQLDSAIASNNPAQLQTLSDQLGASTQNLADAVAANTPAAPAP